VESGTEMIFPIVADVSTIDDVPVKRTHLPELVLSETIWEAVCHGDVDTIRLWSDSNPSVNLEAIHVQYECCLLYSAARSGHVDVVQELMCGCPHVNTQASKTSSTPLHVACYYGYSDIENFCCHKGQIWKLRTNTDFYQFRRFWQIRL